MEDDYLENEPYEICPNCYRSYDHIDYDFQSCTKCGWDAKEERHNPKLMRKPDEHDYLNGDADILTGEWY